MPEGHTIHRLARDHAALFAGQRLSVSSPQGRFVGTELVDGYLLEGTDAWGKHLFYEFEQERLVHVHLGLYGRYFRWGVPPPEPRPTCRMRLVGGTAAVDLVGATRCELLTPDERDAVVARLGPDPLRRQADPERAWRALQRRRVPIGRALLDQAVVSGVGNVFRAEALFVHGLHPELPSAAVDRETWDELWATLVRMLRAGVRQGRIVTVPKGERRGGARTFVYRREHCTRCGSPVRRWDLAGRWAYACPVDQPFVP